MKISLVYKMKYFFPHDIMMNFRQYGWYYPSIFTGKYIIIKDLCIMIQTGLKNLPWFVIVYDFYLTDSVLHLIPLTKPWDHLPTQTIEDLIYLENIFFSAFLLS